MSYLSTLIRFAEVHDITALQCAVMPAAVERLAQHAKMDREAFALECLRNVELGDYVATIISGIDVPATLGEDDPFVKRMRAAGLA